VAVIVGVNVQEEVVELAAPEDKIPLILVIPADIAQETAFFPRFQDILHAPGRPYSFHVCSTAVECLSGRRYTMPGLIVQEILPSVISSQEQACVMTLFP